MRDIELLSDAQIAAQADIEAAQEALEALDERQQGLERERKALLAERVECEFPAEPNIEPNQNRMDEIDGRLSVLVATERHITNSRPAAVEALDSAQKAEKQAGLAIAHTKAYDGLCDVLAKAEDEIAALEGIALDVELNAEWSELVEGWQQEKRRCGGVVTPQQWADPEFHKNRQENAGKYLSLSANAPLITDETIKAVRALRSAIQSEKQRMAQTRKNLTDSAIPPAERSMRYSERSRRLSTLNS